MRCNRCLKTDLPPEAFYVQRARPSGRQPRCKMCSRERMLPRMPEPDVIPEGGMTHDAIAAVLGVSRVRVQQIEKSALATLRNGLEKLGYGPEDIARALSFRRHGIRNVRFYLPNA